MGILGFDDEATQRLLAVYTTPDVVAQRRAFAIALGPRRGQRVVDVGSGPGFLTSMIAAAVGPTGAVYGIDISEPLNAIAREHCKQLPWVEIQHGGATHLPLDGASIDAAISTQVLEYVDDVDAAIGELFRVVRPGGRALIVDTDWDSIVWNASDPDRMKRVLLAWEQHVPHPHLPRELPRRLRRAGFRIESQEVLPLFNPTFVQESYSNRTIDLIQSYVTSRAGISLSEASKWAEDIRATGEGGEYFFSLNRYMFLAARP